jgi:CarD family transcriptional regulator
MAIQRKTTTKTVATTKAAPVAKKAPAPAAKKPAAAAPSKASNVVRLPAARPAPAAAAVAPVKMMPPKAANTQDLSKVDFVAGDYVVYPVHGVGRVERVETIAIAGISVTTYVIHFETERMTLKVPISKARTAGLRKLSSKDRIKTALETLTGKAHIRRIMWSRRAQEYDAKINSGDPVSIAEVVRDLHRATDQPEQSYSERQIYQAALQRLAREVAAIEKIDEAKATAKLESALAKAA